MTLIFISCDVRRNDKVVDDAVKNMESAKLDTTTVQLIDSVYNFGSITEGEKVTYNFRFKNSGKKPLVITQQVQAVDAPYQKNPKNPYYPAKQAL